MNESKGFILCQHLWKIFPKGQNFVVFFDEKIQTPFKNLSSLGGVQITNGTFPLPGIIEAPVKNK